MIGRSRLIGLLAVLALLGLTIGLAACGSDDEESGGTEAAAPAETGESGGGGEAEGEVRQVRYLLPYNESISFLGLLVALENGCFTEEGLELQIEATEGSDYVLQQLIAGNADFGQTGADNILIANAQGHPMRGLAQMGGRGIFTIVAPEETDVDEVADLKGKKLGVTDLGGGEIPLVRAAIADAGLTEGRDVELVVVGPGGPAAFNALQSGEIAAYAGANNDIAGMIAAGLEPQNIVQEKFKHVPTTELSVMEETLDDPENVEIAESIARCYRDGSEFAVENPEEALEMACKRVPEECEDPAVAQAFLDSVIESYAVPEGAEHYTDHVPKDSYDLVQTTLAAEEISEPQDLDVVFPDTIIEAINAG